jgi:hypothetical protein
MRKEEGLNDASGMVPGTVFFLVWERGWVNGERWIHRTFTR